jgi:hypothetical protein
MARGPKLPPEYRDADQAHDEERTYRGEITTRRVSVEARGAEHRGGDKERSCDTCSGKNEENRCQRKSHDGAEDPEQRLGGRGRH